MSRLLPNLLGAREPHFSLLIKRLEHASGRPSADVRLSAEVAAASRQKIEALGLDAADTTGPELYHSLQQLIGQHDRLLRSALRHYGAVQDEALGAHIAAVVQALSLPKTCWALKPAAAKRLVKAHPPKNVMKLLGYRSLDSLLKREPVNELYAGMILTETAAWRQRFIGSYKTLTSSDFETRDIAIVPLAARKWGQAAAAYPLARRDVLLPVREVGAVAILPLPATRFPGLAITLLPRLIQALHEVRLFSLRCRLSQVRPDFGARTARAAAGEAAVFELAGQPLSWKVLQRHLGSHHMAASQALLEPHVQRDDMHWLPMTEVMASLHGAFGFWHGGEYAGASYPDGVVSYNLLDAGLNYCNNVPYHKRIVYHMREALWYELYARYLRQPHIAESVLKQMETTLTT